MFQYKCFDVLQNNFRLALRSTFVALGQILCSFGWFKEILRLQALVNFFTHQHKVAALSLIQLASTELVLSDQVKVISRGKFQSNNASIQLSNNAIELKSESV